MRTGGGDKGHEDVAARPGGKPGRWRTVFAAVCLLVLSEGASAQLSEVTLPASASGPTWITVGPDQNLWVTCDTSNSIARVTTAGVVTAFPFPTPCDELQGCTPSRPVPKDGALWFDEATNFAIGEISMSGVITEHAVIDGGGHSLAVADDGSAWSVQQTLHRLRRWNQGSVSVVPLTTSPFHIIAGAGRLWFSEDQANRIGSVTLAGVVSEFSTPTIGSHPTAITVAPGGEVWFVESAANKIANLDPRSGRIVEFDIPTAHASPTAIRCDPFGRVWIAEYNANQVGMFDPTSRRFQEFPLTPGAYPWDLTWGPDGRVWITELGRGNLAVLQVPFAGNTAIPVLPAWAIALLVIALAASGWACLK